MKDRVGTSFEEFLASASAGVDDERQRVRARPDLADVVAGAHAMAPELVPGAWVAASCALPPAADDVAAASATTPAALEFFLDEVRAQLDEETARAPKRTTEPRSSGRVVSRVALAAAVFAVAAVTVLGISWMWPLVELADDDGVGEAAADLVQPRDEHVRGFGPEGATLPVQPRADEREPSTHDGATHDPSSLPSPGEETRSDASETSRRPAIARHPKGGAERPHEIAAAEPSLVELEREAQRRWQEGDVRGARELFEQIAERGGRSSIAELALGDLITLALRSGDQGRVRAAWSKYLARFPRGRYADDARAGLCRIAAPAKAKECWHRYLEDWTDGAHRGEAREHAEPR